MYIYTCGYTYIWIKVGTDWFPFSLIVGTMMEEEQTLVKGGTNLEGSEAKLELTVDEVVEEYVGSLGFSQLVHVLLVSLAWIFDAQSTLVTIFTDAQPPWRCKSGLCRGYNNSSSNTGSVCELVSGTWEWVGGHTSSTIAEWNLVCDRRFLAALPASVYFLGSLIGIHIPFPCSFVLRAMMVSYCVTHQFKFLETKRMSFISFNKPHSYFF